MGAGENRIACQLSLYPLGEVDYVQKIKNVLDTLQKERELEVEVGNMSTFIRGSEDRVWKTLQEIFKSAASEGNFTLSVTLSNVCGVPEE